MSKRNASQAGLSEDNIYTLYETLRTSAPTTEAEYKHIVEDYATMFEVSTACIRNILTCKSRTEDSSKCWPDSIWELYHRELRCVEFQKVDLSVQVLCTHHNRGRPFKSMSAVPGDSGAASNSPDASLPVPKMVPLTDKNGKEKKLAREYKIHLELPQIWQALGCKKASPTRGEVTNSAKSANSD